MDFDKMGNNFDGENAACSRPPLTVKEKIKGLWSRYKAPIMFGAGMVAGAATLVVLEVIKNALNPETPEEPFNDQEVAEYWRRTEGDMTIEEINRCCDIIRQNPEQYPSDTTVYDAAFISYEKDNQKYREILHGSTNYMIKEEASDETGNEGEVTL